MTLKQVIFTLFSYAVRIFITVATSLYHLSGVWSLPYFFVAFSIVYNSSNTLRPTPPWWEDWYGFHTAMWIMAAVCVAMSVPNVASGFLTVDTVVGFIRQCFTNAETEQALLPTHASDDLNTQGRSGMPYATPKQ